MITSTRVYSPVSRAFAGLSRSAPRRLAAWVTLMGIGGFAAAAGTSLASASEISRSGVGDPTISVPFQAGSSSVVLPKITENHRLYLKAVVQEPAVVRVEISGAFHASIGRFTLPVTDDSAQPALIPMVDALGKSLVLAPNGIMFGATVTYRMDVRSGPAPQFLEMVAITTSDTANPAYVAWVEPRHGALGVSADTTVVIELAPGRNPVGLSRFELDDRIPFPPPSRNSNLMGGERLTFRPPAALGTGPHAAGILLRGASDTQVTWMFHIGTGPAVLLAPREEGGYDLFGSGALEWAPSPGGPFQPVPGATYPWSIPARPAESMGFYRVVQ